MTVRLEWTGTGKDKCANPTTLDPQEAGYIELGGLGQLSIRRISHNTIVSGPALTVMLKLSASCDYCRTSEYCFRSTW